VVKIFNTTGAENMADPNYDGWPAAMMFCGDDPSACEIAAALARDIGFEPLYVGPLERARLIEPHARLWIELALVRKLGRGIAFGLMRREG
jgi:8-hydroxy-5-deazaflavin:NADPH oxidoreductase